MPLRLSWMRAASDVPLAATPNPEIPGVPRANPTMKPWRRYVSRPVLSSR
jgi:hypothetical protein